MAPAAWTANAYPPARRSEHYDTWKSENHGEVKVHDPYEWLESSSEETEKWIDAQVELTSKFLNQVPDKEKLEARLTQTTDYAKFSAPSLKKDGRWYWHFNSGLEAQAVIYRSKGSELPDFSQGAHNNAVGEIFFDPNLLSADGTAAISTTAFSPSGEYFAYGISLSGSDFSTVYVRPTSKPFDKAIDDPLSNDPGKLPDQIRFVKFSSVTWTHDNKGFFYQRYPSREEHGDATEDHAGTETTQDLDAKLYYHKIGTPQSDDVVIAEDLEHREYMYGAEVSEVDGRYLMLYARRDTSQKNKLWIADLTKNEIGPNIKWNKVIDEFDAAYEYICNDGTKFYLTTDKDAPMERVVQLDLADPQLVMQNFIHEDKGAHLESISAVDNDKFVVVYKRNVIDELYVYSSTGQRMERLAADFVGSIDVSGVKREHSWFFATLSGFTTPGTIQKYDFTAPSEMRCRVYRTTKVNGLIPEDFVAEQVWYSSKDGTRVPMFIVRHKNTPLDGTAPAFQFGHPVFSSSVLTAIQAYGFIYAVPNIRGGSEFGEEWHLAGTKERKVNVFDDFIAATQFLVSGKYAAPGKVAINGGSNGGLLVAACVNRAPEGTFGAAVAEVGVLDMLKFSQFTIGKAWTSDYGDPQDAHDFDFIYPISPVHNVPKNQILPPMLLMTADHDDRVVPLHSFKHAATLQHAAPGNCHPLLIRIDRKAGHGAGKSTAKRIKDAVARWGFVAETLGLKWHNE
ncbi:prolyl oligopeptidase [Gautieria morchelliformis]|nr:prolyl oligopeptidase [Gautieria morchelliformis]